MNSPSGVDKMTMAPGTSSSAAVASTAAWSAVWSIGLSADEPLVVAPGSSRICARSPSLREGSFCWAKVETTRPTANTTASIPWSFMIYLGSSDPSSIIQERTPERNAPPRPVSDPCSLVPELSDAGRRDAGKHPSLAYRR